MRNDGVSHLFAYFYPATAYFLIEKKIYCLLICREVRALENEKNKSCITVFLGFIFKTICVIINISVLLLLIFCFIFVRSARLSGNSMNPNLSEGDIVFINTYDKNPSAGDIAVIDSSSKNGSVIKRVIAGEGQTVNIDDNGDVYIDNKKLEENYAVVKSDIKGDLEFPAKVPEGCCFVLGDNRMTSHDSRYTDIGMVSTDSIRGTVIMCAYPAEKICWLEDTIFDFPVDSDTFKDVFIKSFDKVKNKIEESIFSVD